MAELLYSELVDGVWAEKALSTTGAAVGPSLEEPDFVDVSGECPRCTHPLVPFRHWLVTISGVEFTSTEQLSKASRLLRDQGLMPETLDAEFDARCTCEAEHPDPQKRTGLKGCGARWTMRVVAP